MKTQLFKHSLPCESTSNHSLYLLQLLSHSRLQWHSLNHSIHALRVILVGLSVSVSEIVNNKRYTAGVFFLLILAPLSSIFYRVFNPAVVNDWYYVNNFYFFYTLSPYIMLLLASVGIFLLFPVKCKTSYLATVWPAGYAIAKIIFFSLFVHTNEQFMQAAPWFLLIIGVLSAFGFLLTSDYLLYRKYHLRDGTIARMQGIIKMPGVDAKTKMFLLEHEEAELENFNQRN